MAFRLLFKTIIWTSDDIYIYKYIYIYIYYWRALEQKHSNFLTRIWFENVDENLAAILSWPQCVNIMICSRRTCSPDALLVRTLSVSGSKRVVMMQLRDTKDFKLNEAPSWSNRSSMMHLTTIVICSLWKGCSSISYARSQYWIFFEDNDTLLFCVFYLWQHELWLNFAGERAVTIWLA